VAQLPSSQSDPNLFNAERTMWPYIGGRDRKLVDCQKVGEFMIGDITAYSKSAALHQAESFELSLRPP
jgi:hypothetical protein